MVKSWLLNTVNQEIYDSILYYDDAVEMWNDLYSRFRVSNLPRKYQLEQSIETLKQGSMDFFGLLYEEEEALGAIIQHKDHHNKEMQL